MTAVQVKAEVEAQGGDGRASARLAHSGGRPPGIQEAT
jgi:hypothetical protein